MGRRGIVEVHSEGSTRGHWSAVTGRSPVRRGRSLNQSRRPARPLPKVAAGALRMLEAVNLTKKYSSSVALDALNLTIAPGEVFCLLGANGAGKTTTINLFLNFIEPSAGTARSTASSDAGAARDEGYVAYIPETGDAVSQSHGTGEPRVLHGPGGTSGLHAHGVPRVLQTRWALRTAPPTGASAATRKGCGRRSVLPLLSRRARKRCCSTSRPRDSIQRRPTNFPTLLKQLSAAASRC